MKSANSAKRKDVISDEDLRKDDFADAATLRKLIRIAGGKGSSNGQMPVGLHPDPSKRRLVRKTVIEYMR